MIDGTARVDSVISQKRGKIRKAKVETVNHLAMNK
jgi:hypothetical protein